MGTQASYHIYGECHTERKETVQKNGISHDEQHFIVYNVVYIGDFIYGLWHPAIWNLVGVRFWNFVCSY